MPLLGFAHALFGHRAQVSLEVGKTECAKHVQAKVEREVNFVGHLVRATEVVGVILGKATHAQKSVQNARALEAVNGAFFGITQGQVAVAM